MIFSWTCAVVELLQGFEGKVAVMLTSLVVCLLDGGLPAVKTEFHNTKSENVDLFIYLVNHAETHGHWMSMPDLGGKPILLKISDFIMLLK